MISCQSCKTENFFIEESGIKPDGHHKDPVAICRSCGNSFSFRFQDLPKQEELIQAIGKKKLEAAKDSFFWYDDKNKQQKYCIIFNIWQFHRFKKFKQAPPEDPSVMILAMENKIITAILQGKKKIITQNTEEAFTGLVLLQDQASGHLVGSVRLAACKKLIGVGIKAYAEALPVPPEDDPEHDHTVFIDDSFSFPRIFKFALLLEDPKAFETPVAYSYGSGFLRGNLNTYIHENN